MSCTTWRIKIPTLDTFCVILFDLRTTAHKTYHVCALLQSLRDMWFIFYSINGSTSQAMTSIFHILRPLFLLHLIDQYGLTDEGHTGYLQILLAEHDETLETNKQRIHKGSVRGTEHSLVQYDFATGVVGRLTHEVFSFPKTFKSNELHRRLRKYLEKTNQQNQQQHKLYIKHGKSTSYSSYHRNNGTSAYI